MYNPYQQVNIEENKCLGQTAHLKSDPKFENSMKVTTLEKGYIYLILPLNNFRSYSTSVVLKKGVVWSLTDLTCPQIKLQCFININAIL